MYDDVNQNLVPAIVDPSKCDRGANCPKITAVGYLEYSTQVFVSTNIPKVVF